MGAMCGIAGFVERGRGRSAAEMEALATRMGDALLHRGPDDGGAWADAAAGVALANRRLAIVDLSPAGHQPMVSASGRYRIVFNGELYDFLPLREELEGKGCAFRGRSDTEVLLAAVETWGLVEALRRSSGMFAFALWDGHERKLHFARDRVGEKPLYLGWQGDAFLFGSELKALRAHPAWRGEIDRDVLALFLRFGYVPRPWSIFEGISQLEPGCVLTLSEADIAARATPEAVAWWSAQEAFRAGVEHPFRGDEREATDRLEALIGDAVARQMIADVPLGAFLSGGIDSSTIVALMQARSTRPVKTFTMGFREAEHDEAPHARAVAAHLGTHHEEMLVTPAEALAVIPMLPDIYDEPFADSSQVPTYLVARMARRHVTVSLSGDAGDELFGGYNRYVWARNAARGMGWMPRSARRAVAAAIRAVPTRTWTRAMRAAGPLAPRVARSPGAGGRLHRLAEVATFSDVRELYLRLVSLWDPPGGLAVSGREPATRLVTSMREGVAWRDLAEQLAFLDFVTYLPDDILVKVDRACMAVSLESRVPLLDHRVVEFAASVPPSMKLRRGRGKWLLRQVLARHVPPSLTERPKAGFGMPVDEWLRGPLRSWAEDLLDASRLTREGYLVPAPIRAAWSEHLSGGRSHQYRLWAVLMFQAWLQRWR